MADVGERCGYKWGVAGDVVGCFGGPVANGGTNGDAIRTNRDIGEFRESADVDDVWRGTEPQGHHG